MNLIASILKKIIKTLDARTISEIHNFIIESESGQAEMHKRKMIKLWDAQSLPESRKLIPPPASPSQKVISIWREFILSSPPNKVLVLGSTPLIRDLLDDTKIKNYTVADFSFPMIESGLLLASKAKQENEIWIKSEWTDLPLKENYFDFIIGDLVFTQLPRKNQEKFLEKISLLLANDGTFSLRNHIINTAISDETPQKTVDNALMGMSSNYSSENFFAFLYRLRDGFRDNQAQTSSPKKIAEILANYQTREEGERIILRRTLQAFIKRSRYDLDYISQTENEFEETILPFFKIQEKKCADDYPDARYFPIYFLKKKVI
ncbi:methyltransferase domain-containing protein [Candidatus Giovannonibacteria bacterium]|nr:methyltransferase domain-containing protein [Candidatus Giovannonibacteria bacterium]